MQAAGKLEFAALPADALARSAPKLGGPASALGELLVVALELAGVATSTGAACTSGSVQLSTVLLALGLSPRRRSVRRPLQPRPLHNAEEIDAVLERLPPLRARAGAPGSPARAAPGWGACVSNNPSSFRRTIPP